MPFWLVGWADDVSGVEQVIPDLFAIDHVDGVDCATESAFTPTHHVCPVLCERERGRSLRSSRSSPGSPRLTPLRALVQALHDPRCKVPSDHAFPADLSGTVHKHPYIVHVRGIPPPRSVQEGIQPLDEDYTVSGQDRVWGWRGVFPRVIERREWDAFGRVGGEGESKRSEESEIRGEVECECCALCLGQLSSSLVHGTRYNV